MNVIFYLLIIWSSMCVGFLFGTIWTAWLADRLDAVVKNRYPRL